MDLSDKYIKIDINNYEKNVLLQEQREKFIALIDKYSSKYLITFSNDELKCLIKLNGFNSKVIFINSCLYFNFKLIYLYQPRNLVVINMIQSIIENYLLMKYKKYL